MKFILTSILCLMMCSTASALDLGKPFKKAGAWLAKKSGVKPTVDNANRAANSADRAAQSADAAAKTAEKTMLEVAPNVNDTLESFKNVSDNASITMTLLRWPLFVAAVFLCLWLFGRAIHSCRVAFSRPHRTG